MESMHRHYKATLILLGILMFLSICLFVGANYESQVGRYRMQVITRNNFSDIFVIDTVTGVVKYLGKDEGKPFSEVKGK